MPSSDDRRMRLGHHHGMRSMRSMRSVRVSMRSMRSMRGGFIFRNQGPSLKVHHCQHLASVTRGHSSVNCTLCPRASSLLVCMPLSWERLTFSTDGTFPELLRAEFQEELLLPISFHWLSFQGFIPRMT